MFRRKTPRERAAAAVESALDTAGRKIAKAKKKASKQLAAAEKSAQRELTKAKKSTSSKVAAVRKAAGKKAVELKKAASRTATAVQKTARRKLADAKQGWDKLEPEQRAAILASGATVVAAAVSAVRRPKAKTPAKSGA